MKNTLGLSENTARFRLATLEEATKATIQESKCGDWLDILAHRGSDLVYVGTLENSGKEANKQKRLLQAARDLLACVLSGPLPDNPSSYRGVKELRAALEAFDK